MKKLTQENSQELKEKKEKKNNPNEGHRIRLKERYLKVGFDGLHEVEKLELLLFFAIPQRDTKGIARDLIEHFGSLAHVLEANRDQLLQVKGVTPNSALLISMLLPLWNEYQSVDRSRYVITNIDSLGEELIKYYQGVKKEKVIALCVDPSCKVIAIEEICDGDLTGVVLNCRVLIEKVLKYSEATAVILAHNHPLGMALPSREDIASTIDVVRMMKTMGINIIDHYIVTVDDFVSMSQSESFSYIFR